MESITMQLQSQNSLMLTLSDQLLALNKLARTTPTPNFLGEAVSIVRDHIHFHHGWWGLASDNSKTSAPFIYQSELINLPEGFVKAWQEIAIWDEFGDRIRFNIGQTQRYSGTTESQAPPIIQQFCEQHDLYHAMGLALGAESTGHGFFVVIYRGQTQTEFSSQEAFYFQLFMQHVLQQWQFSLRDAFEQTTRESVDLAGIANLQGRLVFLSPSLSELLSKQWPSWDGQQLPLELVQVFQHLPTTLRWEQQDLQLSLQQDLVYIQSLPLHHLASQLAPREHRVATLYAQGHSYKEIAQLVALSPATVRTYIRDAYLRLGVSNKIQLSNALSCGSQS